MRRLQKLDVNKLEQQYFKMIENQDEEPQNFEMKDLTNTDSKTFFIQPGNVLVDYDDNLIDTEVRPGIPGPWAASERWIYQ